MASTSTRRPTPEDGPAEQLPATAPGRVRKQHSHSRLADLGRADVSTKDASVSQDPVPNEAQSAGRLAVLVSLAQSAYVFYRERA